MIIQNEQNIFEKYTTSNIGANQHTQDDNLSFKKILSSVQDKEEKTEQEEKAKQREEEIKETEAYPIVKEKMDCIMDTCGLQTQKTKK